MGLLAFFFIEFEDEDDDYDNLTAPKVNRIIHIPGEIQQQQQQQQQQTVFTPTAPAATTDSNPKLEAYVQQLIVQGYDENTARAYAEQYRDRF